MQLDISNYYSTINEVLNSALMYAQRKTKMTMNEINVVKAMRKTIFTYDNYWTKSDSRDCYDIAVMILQTSRHVPAVGTRADFPKYSWKTL